MNRRLVFLLLLALLLALTLSPAAAQPTITAKEFLEQVVLPAAMESREKRFTMEELQAMKAQAEEKGFAMSRELSLQFSAYGGAFKDSIMKAVLADSLGPYPSTWPIEAQAWWEALMVQAGVWPQQKATVPQPGDISREEALAIAQETIQAAYHEEEDLFNPANWRLHLTYQNHWESPEVAWRQWEIWLEPLQLEQNSYILLVRNDGALLSKQMEPGIRAQEVTPQEVEDRYSRLFGTMNTWAVDTWLAFKKDLKTAIDHADPSQILGSLPVFVMQEYLRPTADMLTADLAIAAAAAHPEAPQDVELGHSSALLLLDGETPVWKVRLIPSLPGNSWVQPFLAEVDAITGEVRAVRQTDAATYSPRRDYQLDRYLETGQVQPTPPQPTLRPDGKPFYWYSDRAPKYFWEAMDKLYAQGEASDLLNQWFADYGSNQNFWPLEAQALAGLTFDNISGMEGPINGLPDEKDITPEEAVAIAKEALKQDGMDAAELEDLLPGVSFYYTQDTPSGHMYMVQFFRFTGSLYESLGVVTIDARTGAVISTGGNG